MCGIFCSLTLSPPPSPDGHAPPEGPAGGGEHLRRRGPDSSRVVTVTGGPPAAYSCLLAAHVLHMRGRLTAQPLEDAAGNVLLWNGEVFGGLPLAAADNDAAAVSARLASCGGGGGPGDVLGVLSSLRGPWAFVYYQRDSHFLWFGRDFFGRRSLLWSYDAAPRALTLASVAASGSGRRWREVPAAGVYRVDLKAPAAAAGDGAVALETFPWAGGGQEAAADRVPDGCRAVANRLGLALPSPVRPLNAATDLPASEATNGGSGGQLSSQDAEALLAGGGELAERLVDVLSEAVRRRVQALPLREGEDGEDTAAVAILFSGGVDSMVLAALADRHVPARRPIDLLNVAFRLRGKLPEAPGAPGAFDVPDRLTGRAGAAALRRLNPERSWRFVEVDVTAEELQEARRQRVRHLLHPLDSVLDDSIGCAVWFAARGAGLIAGDDGERRTFTSTAKVVLTGIGADEQLGGYSRHREVFRRGGWGGLVRELQEELGRISSRNLGRDDRTVADHGKEARFPYLDEDVVSFLSVLPVWDKAQLALPRGVGDKLLLRRAAWRLGLADAAALPKRAMQFGSRIAKMEERREKASDRCSRLVGTDHV